ncbi:hypothetical protein L1049_019841 [Liquidambar formosana]|uniref:Uncharacterized protein n=1 Tax=Liquidambar formosana TaxID=63359 RepID=A0AAP0SC84_LIQFO
MRIHENVYQDVQAILASIFSDVNFRVMGFKDIKDNARNRSPRSGWNFSMDMLQMKLQILLNPLYLPGSRITSSHFDTKVRALARKYL